MLTAKGDHEERQADSSDSDGFICHPISSKEVVVGEEEGEELSDENGSNCSEFLKVSLLDYDLEKQPPVIYTKDNSSDIFPEFFPKKRKTERNSKIIRGRRRRGYHIVNEEILNHIGDTDDDDDDDDYILGGYTKPIQKEPLILRRSREDIREELLESEDSEFDEDQGGYTRNTPDQPTIIDDDSRPCELGCITDETTSDPDGGYTCSFLQINETNPLVVDKPQSDNNDSDEYIGYAISGQHKSQLLDMPNLGSLETIDDGLEWDSSDDDNDGYTIGKSLVEPIITKPPWDVDDGLEWDSSDDEETGPRYTKQKYNSISTSDETEFSSSTKTTRSSDQAAEECGAKGVNQMELKCDVISEEIERCSPEPETGPNKLLIFDPSQHVPRTEEVQVVQAPPPEPNGSQDVSENGKRNAEGLEDIPDEEEQLYEVDSSAMVDERHDPGETNQGSDGDRTRCARNTDSVAAGGTDDEGAAGDRYLQSDEGVASRDAHEIKNHDDASRGTATHSGYAGVVNDSGYGSAGSAVFDQTFSFMRAIVMILGYNNAGKTCLRDTLLELPFKDPKDPSDAEESHSDELDDLSNCKVTGIHAHVTGQHWTRLDESFGEALKNDLETRLTDTITTDNRRRAEQELTTRLKILDMDGEFPFYQTHPMLMSKSMVYLVVMDVTKKLTDNLPESTLPEQWKGRIEYPNTPRKFLDLWLSSISTFLNEHDLPDQHLKTKSIVIVLTHTDKLDPRTRKQKIKKFEQDVRAHVKKQHAAKYVVKNIIAVSNTNREICRDELGTLKDTVLRLAESKPTFRVTKPCTWLQLEANIAKVPGRNYLTVREIRQLSGPVGMSRKQFKEFLTVHKEIGSLHYIDDESDDSLVVTDRQFLVDSFMSIIDMWINKRTSQWSLTDQEALETDLDDGIFSPRTLGLIWKNWDETIVENLASMLKSSRLFISWRAKDEQGNVLPVKYIVPCLQLPLVEPENDVQETSAPKTLVYFFHTAQERRMVLNSGFLPRGFLFLVITSLMEEKENRGRWEKTKLYCNGATFRTGTRGDIYLTMSTDAAVIKLNVTTRQHPRSDNISAEIATARSTFEDEVKQLLRSRFPNVRCSVCVSPCYPSREINQSKNTS